MQYTKAQDNEILTEENRRLCKWIASQNDEIEKLKAERNDAVDFLTEQGELTDNGDGELWWSFSGRLLGSSPDSAQQPMTKSMEKRIRIQKVDLDQVPEGGK